MSDGSLRPSWPRRASGVRHRHHRGHHPRGVPARSGWWTTRCAPSTRPGRASGASGAGAPASRQPAIVAARSRRELEDAGRALSMPSFGPAGARVPPSANGVRHRSSALGVHVGHVPEGSHGLDLGGAVVAVAKVITSMTSSSMTGRRPASRGSGTGRRPRRRPPGWGRSRPSPSSAAMLRRPSQNSPMPSWPCFTSEPDGVLERGVGGELPDPRLAVAGGEGGSGSASTVARMASASGIGVPWFGCGRRR